jgi:site-specific DNA-methyltransferase (adenine-specific)
MRAMDAESIDAIVSDPPYGLSFMGKGWDHGVPGQDFWIEALRVAKPGAHLLAFGGTRTFHRLVVAIEDAGWEIRDCLMWVYGSGFPKSLDVSKAIDKAAGAKREVIGVREYAGGHAGAHRVKLAPPIGTFVRSQDDRLETAPATDSAKAWQGWGTALKPAYEPIIMARKPLTSTVAANVLKHGTGAINVDGCRVGTNGGGTSCNNRDEHGKCRGHKNAGRSTSGETFHGPNTSVGRWPANVLHDGFDEVTGLMGDAARFFYCAKASKADRDEGCAGLTTRKQDETRNEGDPGGDNPRNRGADERSNHHPTVKPTDLMRYLCRLVTPPGGTVLDPFMGSGSTGKAATLEGFSFVGCELQPEYMAIAEARIRHAEGEVEPLLRVRL